MQPSSPKLIKHQGLRPVGNRAEQAFEQVFSPFIGQIVVIQATRPHALVYTGKLESINNYWMRLSNVTIRGRNMTATPQVLLLNCMQVGHLHPVCTVVKTEPVKTVPASAA